MHTGWIVAGAALTLPALWAFVVSRALARLERRRRRPPADAGDDYRI
jgi:hypothetical protein